MPVHEIAMMMSIALRFIPILTEELDKIMKAQMSRGVDFESGNILERGKKLIPVLVPLFIAAIREHPTLRWRWMQDVIMVGKERPDCIRLFMKNEIILRMESCCFMW